MQEQQLKSLSGSVQPRFIIGYYQLHPDVNFNFQMNRWISYMGEAALADMRRVAPTIKTFADWKREFLALGARYEANGDLIYAGYYYRLAEFFMFADDPDKKVYREKFLANVRTGYGIRGEDRHLVPYDDGRQKGFLPAYRFTPDRPCGTIVVFGGGDSYVEEWLPFLLDIRDRGYDVVCYEAPGQGGALEDYHLYMTADWHISAKAVLDYFGLDDVTLVGISGGGLMVMRTAAYEPRIKRVVALDALYDALEAWMSGFSPAARLFFRMMLSLRARPVLNAVMGAAMKRSLWAKWAMSQAMHTEGVSTPYDNLKIVSRFNARDVSHLVKQDVLLLCGSEDHAIPVSQLYKQMQALTNAKSITARIFTRAEHAQSHGQVGNIGLAIDVIVGWVDLTVSHSSDRAAG